MSKIIKYGYHSSANPIGKITRRYAQVMFLAVSALAMLYANHWFSSDYGEGTPHVMIKPISVKNINSAPSTAAKPHLRKNDTNSIQNNKPAVKNRTSMQKLVSPYAISGPLEFNNDCPKKTWKSDHILTGYEMPPSASCHGDSCALNTRREPIKVDQTKLKYDCESVESCVTVNIKTRHRFNTTSRLINSVHYHYPEVQVIVTDDKNTKTDSEVDPNDLFRLLTHPNHVRYHQVSPSVGGGRKVAAEKSRTPFILVLDDDHVLSENTSLVKMLDVLQHTDASIVGGDHKYDFRGRYQGVMHFAAETSTNETWLQIYEGLFHDIVPCFPGCYVADVVKNLFMADKEVILTAGSWDTSLPCWEHEDFFCTMRQKQVKIAFCDNISFLHKSPGDELRRRRKTFKSEAMVYIFRKWNITGFHLCQSPKTYSTEPICPKSNRIVPQ